MRTQGNSGLVLATKNGSAVRFDEKNVRAMGRVARGVRGIKLREGDYVCGVAVVDETKKLITITENGFGKKTEFSDFREMKNRGGMGIVCHSLNEKTGLLAGISVVDDDNDIMMITDQGQMIRIRVSDIPTYSRSARGVIVMRLAEDQHIVNFTKVAKEEPEDEVAPTVESVEGETVEVIEEITENEEAVETPTEE